MADSKYIQHTRRSPYLESLLIPAVGPRPIPDDVMKEHTDKPETTTYNISSPASGSGLFVFYPNNGTGLVGTHYIFTGGKYVYDNTTGPLVTAQDLYQNYNYGRLISQIITTKSSTLPAGVYALNGTINTINIYNTLSEVSGGLTYNNILSLNNNITDKVGNVLVGDGVATLSLPQTFNKPFVRFNDPTPFSLGNGVTASLNPVMIDDNNSQVCMSTLAMSIPKATNTTVSTINIDSTTPMMISGTVNYTVATAAAAGFVQIMLVFLDAFAGVISTKVVFRTIGLNAGIHTQPFSFNYTGSYYTDNTQPVGAVQVQISQTSGAAMLMSLNLAIRPLGANNPGANQPIALVAYQGVATGSQITLSGITNYELIPNSNLKKNVKTEYGHYDPAEFDYVKRILQNKDQFGIRSVYSLPDYNRAKETFRDLYLLDSEVIARSFSWNKLLKIIKDIVLKGTAAAFPVSRPVIDVIDDFATNNIDKYVRSAGGTPVVGAVRSAGGLPVAMAKNHIKMFARAADAIGLETPEDSDDEPLDFSLPFCELTNRLAKCYSIGAEIIEKNPDSLIEKAVFNVKAKMTSLGFIPMDKYPSQLGTVVARELCDILESFNDAIHSGLQPLSKFRMLHAKGMLINTISLAKGDHSIIEENQGLMDFLNKHPLEGSKVAEVVARSMESELISLRDQGIISNDELDSFVVRRDTPNINLDEEILKNSSGDTILDLCASNTVGALFPVLLTEGTRSVGCMLYIAVKGDYSMYLPEAARGYYTLSINGYKIHGLMNDKFNLNILSDVTLLPVTEVRGNRVSVAQVGFVVVESSCYGAIASVQLANWIGVKGVAITGNVIRASYPSYDVPVAQELINSVLMPNPVSYIKREYLASIGLQMIESTENASYAMRAVIQLMSSYPQAEAVAKVRALDSVEELSMAILDKIATVARSMDVNFDDLPPPPPELLAPLAEEEPYGFELPPPVVSDTMQVKEVWDEATALLSESDQVFKEGIDVLNWLYKNKLVTTMGEYIRTDPDGSRFRRMMVNYVTNVEGVVRLTANPTAADAQRAKAERLSASLQQQYPEITASWVIKNGYRGPSTEQARYFHANRRLPEPGYTPIDALGDKVEAIVLNVLKGFKSATQAQEEALRTLVRDVQRGPKPDELHTIFGVGRGDLERVINNTISNNRLNSEESAAARAKIMEKGSGLTSEELAEIRGRQVRNRTRLEPLAPAAPIYTTPGPTRGRLARMLATNTELV